MKKSFCGFDIEISDWTPKLKAATVIFAVITIVSSVMALFFKFIIPGWMPLAMGVTMLLLGIREFNVYLKDRKSKWILILGMIFTLIFAFDLYIGAKQILTAVSQQL